MLKKIIFYFSVLIAVCLVSQHAYASSEQGISIRKNSTYATIVAKEKGDYYKLYDNDKLVYEGKKDEIKVKIKDEIQKYNLGIYKSNKLKKVIAIKIDNSSYLEPKQSKSYMKSKAFSSNNENELYPEQEIVDNSINQNGLDTHSSSDGVRLKWGKIQGDNGVYSIYRDNKLLKKTKSKTYFDSNVKPGKSYTYKVETNVPLSKKSQNKVNELLAKRKINKSKLSKSEKSKLYNISAEFSSIVEIPKLTEDSLKSPLGLLKSKGEEGKSKALSTKAAFPKNDAYSIIYNTFIPYKSVKDPNFIKGGYLKGDNRGFNINATSSRTHSVVNLQFQNPLSIWMPTKKIGRSYRCSDAACKKVIESAVASNKAIFIDVTDTSSKKLGFKFYHSAKIPFNTNVPGVSYPSIDSNWKLTMTNSTLVISGSHDKAPNHEIYLASMGGQKRQLYTFFVTSPNDFINLLEIMPRKSFKNTL